MCDLPVQLSPEVVANVGAGGGGVCDSSGCGGNGRNGAAVPPPAASIGAASLAVALRAEVGRPGDAWSARSDGVLLDTYNSIRESMGGTPRCGTAEAAAAAAAGPPLPGAGPHSAFCHLALQLAVSQPGGSTAPLPRPSTRAGGDCAPGGSASDSLRSNAGRDSWTASSPSRAPPGIGPLRGGGLALSAVPASPSLHGTHGVGGGAASEVAFARTFCGSPGADFIWTNGGRSVPTWSEMPLPPAPAPAPSRDETLQTLSPVPRYEQRQGGSSDGGGGGAAASAPAAWPRMSLCSGVSVTTVTTGDGAACGGPLPSSSCSSTQCLHISTGCISKPASPLRGSLNPLRLSALASSATTADAAIAAAGNDAALSEAVGALRTDGIASALSTPRSLVGSTPRSRPSALSVPQPAVAPRHVRLTHPPPLSLAAETGSTLTSSVRVALGGSGGGGGRGLDGETGSCVSPIGGGAGSGRESPACGGSLGGTAGASGRSSIVRGVLRRSISGCRRVSNTSGARTSLGGGLDAPVWGAGAALDSPSGGSGAALGRPQGAPLASLPVGRSDSSSSSVLMDGFCVGTRKSLVGCWLGSSGGGGGGANSPDSSGRLKAGRLDSCAGSGCDSPGVNARVSFAGGVLNSPGGSAHAGSAGLCVVVPGVASASAPSTPPSQLPHSVSARALPMRGGGDGGARGARQLGGVAMPTRPLGCVLRASLSGVAFSTGMGGHCTSVGDTLGRLDTHRGWPRTAQDGS
eukprot:349816-Chlamydomonas_euryale.AAC.1